MFQKWSALRVDIREDSTIFLTKLYSVCLGILTNFLPTSFAQKICNHERIFSPMCVKFDFCCALAAFFKLRKPSPVLLPPFITQ